MVEFTESTKVVVIGPAKCGKSALVSRLVNNEFLDEYMQTFGAELHQKALTIEDNQTTVLDIWSCSGQKRYAVSFDQFMDRAKIAIVCFDLTDLQSFNESKFWYDRLKTVSPDTRVIFGGMKCDLTDKIVVPEKDIMTQTKMWGAEYYPLSCKSEANFSQLVSKLIQWSK